MKRISNLFKFLSNSNTPLGRWKIHNYNETIIKINFANEDNCGLCCQKYKSQLEKILEEDNYIYMMGYESIHSL
jgi:hypothetical protein